MLHPAETPDQESARTDQPARAVANPRRTRLGADGRPVDGPRDARRD